MANQTTDKYAGRLLKLVALGFAGAGLVAVLLSATIWAPGEGVSTSQADILDLFTGSDRPNASFERALKSLGHEPPRAFDINGNTVYFSISQVDQSLDEVLRRYQDEFVYQKLNARTYLTQDDAGTQQALQDMLTGGIVPLEIGPEHLAMGGGLTENKARNPEQLTKLQGAYSRGEIDKKFRAYRHIEAFRDSSERYTTVVASWSDNKFDYRKMLPGSDVPGQNVDPQIPACPSCLRVQRFEDLDPNADYTEHIFIGERAPGQVLDFYHKVLSEQGWLRSDAAHLLTYARNFGLQLPASHTQQYQRGDEQLNLLIYLNDDKQTVAHLTLFDD